MGDGDLNKRSRYYHPAHKSGEKPGNSRRRLGLEPGSAGLESLAGEPWAKVRAIPIRHRAAISITRDKDVKTPGTCHKTLA